MSKFTWRELLDLNDKEKAWKSSLSCIGHIDMNAFFAQVDQVRYNLSVNDPVVSVQWSSIIAVSYAARKYGISRLDTLESARVKCPHLVAVHTATFLKGERIWKSTPLGKFPSPYEHKVSLDPYRREGRKILQIFQKHCDLVQKASVDESFLDLGRLVFKVLLLDSDEVMLNEQQLEALKEIKAMYKTQKYSIDDQLPPIPKLSQDLFPAIGNVIKEEGSAFIYTDWDDLVIAIGSMLTDMMRKDVFTETKYFTSCGVSNNKSLSKIASDFKKPDTQTIIFNKAINIFLDNGCFELTDFWTLGGNKGKEVLDLLECPKFDKQSINHVRETWPVLEDLQKAMKDRYVDLSIFQKFTFPLKDCDSMCLKIFNLTRGSWKEPVNSRPLVKSMTSNKNMRGDACKDLADCASWLQVFAGELELRINELQEESNKLLIPKTISVSIRSENRSSIHSKSGPFLMGRSSMTRDEFFLLIFDTAVPLVKELDMVYKDTVYPLTGLMLTLSNFEIIGKGSTIVDMFNRPKREFKDDSKEIKLQPVAEKELKKRKTFFDSSLETKKNVEDEKDSFVCDECFKKFNDQQDLSEHKDYHFALNLSIGMNGIEKHKTILNASKLDLMTRKRLAGDQSKKKSIKDFFSPKR
ncbi:hypothetical protein QEN19_001627 [Hanseniaspora menglaensis]